MCTSIIYINYSNEWPVIIGSNRDEDLNRESKFPGRHWANNYPNIIAGKDEEKQGSWLGINDFNIVSIIHNRKKNKNIINSISRGKIVLEVLKYSNINKSLEYIYKLNRFDYENFNLLIANSKSVYWVKHDLSEKDIQIEKLNEGISILTEKDLNDKSDEKINYLLNLFSHSKVPRPSNNLWESWANNLTKKNKNFDENKNICFLNYKLNYGTRSSSLIAIPNSEANNKNIVFKSTNSFPLKNNYLDVKI